MKNWDETARRCAMNEATLTILLHQLLFQGSFFLKNVTLSRKLGVPIRGSNPEARRAILFFCVFILLSLLLAVGNIQFARLNVLPERAALVMCLLLLALNMAFGLASLSKLGDSWRVGVPEDQTTELVESGIYRLSRNPYFVAYLLMFAAYTVLLQSLVLLILSCAGFCLVHAMILREEAHLEAQHGHAYQDYQRRVARYLLL